FLWHGVYLPSRLERKRHQTVGDSPSCTHGNQLRLPGHVHTQQKGAEPWVQPASVQFTSVQFNSPHAGGVFAPAALNGVETPNGPTTDWRLPLFGSASQILPS